MLLITPFNIKYLEKIVKQNIEIAYFKHSRTNPFSYNTKLKIVNLNSAKITHVAYTSSIEIKYKQCSKYFYKLT